VQRDQRYAAQGGFFERETDDGVVGGWAVYTEQDRCGRVAGAAGDQDGAAAVCGKVDRHGANQQPGEAAQSAIPDDDQAGGPGGVNQHRGGLAGDEFAVHGEVGCPGMGAGVGVGEDALGLVA
jgi:hypothetical protein